MNCYLCRLEAQQSEPTDDGKLVTCRDCGVYRITKLALKELGPRALNLSKMREDLHRQRQYNATSVAEINTETVIWA
jgi:hypothetical protein